MPVFVHNVRDGRHGWSGSWEVEPLAYEALGIADIGRTVIYRDHGRAEAGTLSSYRDGRVWARFSRGDTAAASDPRDLCFGIRPLDGDLNRASRGRGTTR
jgi:hypothetical protein